MYPLKSQLRGLRFEFLSACVEFKKEKKRKKNDKIHSCFLRFAIDAYGVSFKSTLVFEVLEMVFRKLLRLLVE